MIWNEWFRDENLQNPINLSTYAEISTADGLDDVGMGDRGFVGQHKLLRRGKRHDYFTSALPWPQKGPGVEIGLAGTAQVTSTPHTFGGADWRRLTATTADTVRAFKSSEQTSVHYSRANSGDLSYYDNVGLKIDPSVFNLVADMSQTTSATINSLRQAFQVQKLYERDARGGTRYTEILRSHFGVVSPVS